jgi:hypothetical protein
MSVYSRMHVNICFLFQAMLIQPKFGNLWRTRFVPGVVLAPSDPALERQHGPRPLWVAELPASAAALQENLVSILHLCHVYSPLETALRKVGQVL